MAGRIYIPKRYILATVAHFGFIVIYSVRLDLSIAIVAMVNATYANVKPAMDPECSDAKNNSVDVHVSS